MTEIITQILVEVLKIFGIATKELKRGSASKFPIGCRLIRILTEWPRRTEKYFRKLAGMADLEDAVKKLDRLTQEEARMANAEVMRITHNIRDEVKVVDGKVEELGDEVGDVGGKVRCVDEKVQVVIDGTRSLSSQLEAFLTYMLSDAKQAGKEMGVRIEDVGEKVQCVGDKIQVVIDGE